MIDSLEYNSVIFLLFAGFQPAIYDYLSSLGFLQSYFASHYHKKRIIHEITSDYFYQGSQNDVSSAICFFISSD